MLWVWLNQGGTLSPDSLDGTLKNKEFPITFTTFLVGVVNYNAAANSVNGVGYGSCTGDIDKLNYRFSNNYMGGRYIAFGY